MVLCRATFEYAECRRPSIVRYVDELGLFHIWGFIENDGLTLSQHYGHIRITLPFLALPCNMRERRRALCRFL